jgi:hypothetical protein
MVRRIYKQVVALTVLAPVLLVTAVAEARPITVLEIEFLLGDGKSPEQVIEIIKQRGLSFAVDAAIEAKLKEAGFDAKHIEQIKDLPKPGAKPAGKPAKDANPADANADAKPDGDKPAAGANPAPDAPPLQLEPEMDALFARIHDQVTRTMKDCGLKIERHPSKHITLVASKKIGNKFIKGVSTLEGKLKDRFPEPIASGVDRRAANIALLETRPEYEYWVKSMFKVLRQDGVRFEDVAEGDIEQRMLKSSSFFLQGVFSMCLEEMTDEQQGRSVAYAVGFQYLRQLARYKAPDAFPCGFGNITEVMVFGTPTEMVTSGYMERRLGQAPDPWATIVRGLFAQGKVRSVQNVLAYSTDSMELPEYATCWSFASVLATNPKKFAELVVALRSGDNAWEEISRIYDVKEAKFVATWSRWVIAQNK